MRDRILARSNSSADMEALPRGRLMHLAISKGTARLPRFMRPGLFRESLYLVASMKNRYECVRGLYFRDSAPTRVEFRNGVRLESSPRDSLFFLVEEIVADGCYTPHWFYRPGQDDTVVDIGANIGVFAAHICNLSASARVACFEPDPWSYRTLEQNISSNNLEGRVQTYQAAVWREERVMYLAVGSTGRSVGQKTVAHSDGAGTAVSCISLAKALDSAAPAGGPVALLKIDTEGAETDILEAAGADTMQRVQRVALEYHSDEKRKMSGELLRSYGFNVRWGRGDADSGVCLASRVA